MAEVRAPHTDTSFLKDFMNDINGLLKTNLAEGVSSATAEGFNEGITNGAKKAKKQKIDLAKLIEVENTKKNQIEKEIEELLRVKENKTATTKIQIPDNLSPIIDKKTKELGSSILRNIGSVVSKLQIPHRQALKNAQDQLDKQIEKDPETWKEGSIFEANNRFVNIILGLRKADDIHLTKEDQLDAKAIEQNWDKINDVVTLIGELSVYTKQFEDVKLPKYTPHEGISDIFEEIRDFEEIFMSFPKDHKIRKQYEAAYEQGRNYGKYDITHLLYGKNAEVDIPKKIEEKTKELIEIRRNVLELELKNIEEGLSSKTTVEELDKVETKLNELLDIYGSKNSLNQFDEIDNQVNRIFDNLDKINDIRNGLYDSSPIVINDSIQERTEDLKAEEKQAKETKKAEDELGNALLQLAKNSEKAYKKGEFKESQAYLNPNIKYISDIIEGTINGIDEEVSDALKERIADLAIQILAGLHVHSSSIATPSYDDFFVFADEAMEGIFEQFILGFREITKIDLKGLSSDEIEKIGREMANEQTRLFADFFEVRNLEDALDSGRDIQELISKPIDDLISKLRDIFPALSDTNIEEIKNRIQKTLVTGISKSDFSDLNLYDIGELITTSLKDELLKNTMFKDKKSLSKVDRLNEDVINTITDSIHRVLVGNESRLGGKEVQDKIQLMQREALQTVLSGMGRTTSYSTQKFNPKNANASDVISGFILNSSVKEQNEELNKLGERAATSGEKASKAMKKIADAADNARESVEKLNDAVSSVDDSNENNLSSNVENEIKKTKTELEELRKEYQTLYEVVNSPNGPSKMTKDEVRRYFDLEEIIDEVEGKVKRLQSHLSDGTDNQNEFNLEVKDGVDIQDTLGRAIDANNAKILEGTKLISRQNGQLRVLYHGSNSYDFEKFDPNRIGENGSKFGKGAYFAFNKSDAETYGYNVSEWFANITKIYNDNVQFSEEELTQIFNEYKDDIESLWGSIDLDRFLNKMFGKTASDQRDLLANDITGLSEDDLLKKLGYQGRYLQLEEGNGLVVFDLDNIIKARDVLSDIQQQSNKPPVSTELTTLPSQIEKITQAEDRMGNAVQEATDQARQGLVNIQETNEELNKTSEIISKIISVFNGKDPSLIEQFIIGNSKNGYFTEPILGEYDYISSELVNSAIQGAKETIDTFVHTHPERIASFTHDDIYAAIEEMQQGIIHQFVKGSLEISYIDFSKLGENTWKSIAKDLERRYNQLVETNGWYEDEVPTQEMLDNFQSKLKEALINSIAFVTGKGIDFAKSLYKTFEIADYSTISQKPISNELRKQHERIRNSSDQISVLLGHSNLTDSEIVLKENIGNKLADYLIDSYFKRKGSSIATDSFDPSKIDLSEEEQEFFDFSRRYYNEIHNAVINAIHRLLSSELDGNDFGNEIVKQLQELLGNSDLNDIVNVSSDTLSKVVQEIYDSIYNNQIEDKALIHEIITNEFKKLDSSKLDETPDLFEGKPGQLSFIENLTEAEEKASTAAEELVNDLSRVKDQIDGQMSFDDLQRNDQIDYSVQSEEKLLPMVIESTDAIEKRNEEMRRMQAIQQTFMNDISQSNEAKINRDITETLEKRRKEQEKLNEAKHEEVSTSLSSPTADVDIKAEESAKAAEKEAEAMSEVKEESEKASTSKRGFAKANAEVLQSIKESLTGLGDEAEFFKALNNIINKFSGKDSDKRISTLANNIVKIKDALTGSIDDNSFISALQKLSEQGENLKNLADVLKASRKQIESAKDIIDNSNELSQEDRDALAYQLSQSKEYEREQKRILAIEKEIEKARKEGQKQAEKARIKAEADAEKERINTLEKLNNELDSYNNKLKTNITRDDQQRLSGGGVNKNLLNEWTSLQSRLTDIQNKLKSGEINTSQARAEFDKLKESIDKALSPQSKKFEKIVPEEVITKLGSKIEEFASRNTNLGKELSKRFEEVRARYEALLNSSATGDALERELKAIDSELNKIKADADKAGESGKSFGHKIIDSLTNANARFIANYLSIQDMIRYARTAFETIHQLDTALVDLKKTTTMSNSELEDFYHNSSRIAKQMGVSSQEIISQASAWSRLGYSSKEAAESMAELSSQFAKISPGTSVEDATDYLVSTMKAFNIDVANVESDIMDSINRIGNTMATSNQEVGEMLKRSSAAMAAANNSLAETIALESAAVQITRNAETTGTAFRTISMRIRGYDEETEEQLEDYEELTGKIADLTKTAKTPGGISLFTDASKTEYKSTYQLLKEIAEIYEDLTDKDQAALLEILAGKRGGQVLAGILNDFSEVERAMKEIEQSAGSADKEMDIIEQSFDYKINALKETWVGFLTELADRGALASLIDALTKLSEVLTGLLSQKGAITGLFSIITGALATKKNVGGLKSTSPTLLSYSIV